MNKITGNESATALVKNGGLINEGLTIRQHFAAMAMQGMLANDWKGYKFHDDDCTALSKAAVNYADALIIELNKSTNE